MPPPTAKRQPERFARYHERIPSCPNTGARYRHEVPLKSICALLLAAGSARRFGAAKLLAPMADGTPLAIAAARRMRAASDSLLAVVRPDDASLQGLLSAEGIDWVINPHAEHGIGASIACAIAARSDADGWMIGLADMPHIRTETIAAVRDTLASGTALVAPVHGGRRGHPVGFAAAFRGELLALDGDWGARRILQRHADALRLVPVDDPGIERDVDVPADLDCL